MFECVRSFFVGLPGGLLTLLALGCAVEGAERDGEAALEGSADPGDELVETRTGGAGGRPGALPPLAAAGGASGGGAASPCGASAAPPTEPCVPIDTEECHATAACREEGRCTGSDCGCVAAGPLDCEGRPPCTLEGRCTACGGVCIATSDADCERSSRCANIARACRASEGRCVEVPAECGVDCEWYGLCFSQDGHCVPNAPEHCSRSVIACGSEARCTLGDGECIIGSDADCRGSSLCSQEGRCSFDGTTCVATDQGDCLLSSNCQWRALCQLGDGVCVALTDAECKPRPTCLDDGKCAVSNGVCVATDEGCAATENCQKYGRCSARDGACALVGDADCDTSGLCEREGRCAFLGGNCHTTGDTDEECAEWDTCNDGVGWCSSVDGICAVTSDEQCVPGTYFEPSIWDCLSKK